MNEDYQNDFFNKRIPQCFYRMIDQFASIIERHNFYALGQTCLDRRDSGFDILDDLSSIGATLNDHHTTNGVHAILVQDAAPKCRADLYSGHIAHEDRSSIKASHNHFVYVFYRLDQTQSADNVLPVIGFDHFCADIAIAALDSL